MQQETAQPIGEAHQSLPYAALVARALASFFSIASLVMATVTVAWLLPPYLCWRDILVIGPFAQPRGGPLGEALADTALWPAGVTFALGIVGIAKPRRRHRWFGALAIGIVCAAFPGLQPLLWR